MPGVDNAAKLSLDYGSSESAPILGRMNWLISHDELYAMCGEENGNFGCEILSIEKAFIKQVWPKYSFLLDFFI